MTAMSIEAPYERQPPSGPVRQFPLAFFPAARARIVAMLEDADEERAAGQHRRADRLTDQARAEAHAARAMIGGVS